MPRGISINIGINKLDSDHYGNSFDELNSCEKDARNMASLARSQGFKPADIKLLVKDPLAQEGIKAQEVINEIKKASNILKSVGDFLLVTFSGHGNRIDDINSQKMIEGEDILGFDQTWCLHDRQIIDDELAQLWSSFEKGVRILIISDSCYSGEVFAIADFLGEITITSLNTAEVVKPFEETTKIIVKNSLIKVKENSLQAGDKQLVPSNEVFYKRWEEYRKVKVDLEDALAIEKSKPGNQNVKSFRDLIKASVISISACGSEEKAKDGNSASDNSIFTAALKYVWYGTYTPSPTQVGNFTGDYDEFFQMVKVKTLSINSEQEPILDGFNNDTFKKQKPCFKI